jgi:hypothetical protein
MDVAGEEYFRYETGGRKQEAGNRRQESGQMARLLA